MGRARTILLPAVVVLTVIGLVALAARSPVAERPKEESLAPADDVRSTAARVDQFFADHWATAQLEPAELADELQVLRRLSLALHGTIPSLEEIRQFQADAQPDRLQRWTDRLLADQRFLDYFAERLARTLVGTEGGQFLVYRRDRFVAWLGEQLRQRTPYDEIVRQTIADGGLWTDTPAVNFVTSATLEGDVDENKLAGRVVRAFLGQRIDCAQCHDHPFADWRQADFEGLAAYFGQARLSLAGVEDDTRRDYQVDGRRAAEKRTVEPKVPFHDEWQPSGETRRARLAAWITHPENRRFERAIANRVWGLMFGRAYREPVDDLPDPSSQRTDALDILGADFRAHGCDLRRLIQVIAASKPFRLASTAATLDDAQFETLEQSWAVFPLTRLRPEQVIGAMLQASSLKTIDQNSHLFTRALRFFQSREFVDEYGDLGDEELEEHAGTVAQALLRLNGKFARERSEAGPFSAAGRIAGIAESDESRLETCYLVCLTRLPTPPEREHFLTEFQDETKDKNARGVEDLFWTLFNSPEFAWDH